MLHQKRYHSLGINISLHLILYAHIYIVLLNTLIYYIDSLIFVNLLFHESSSIRENEYHSIHV